MKHKIVITGINGFLGSHLAKRLKQNFQIIGLLNSKTNSYRVENENFDLYSSNSDELEDIFLKHDIYAILHVATIYNNKPINKLIDTNILLPVKLFELANKNNVSVFLNTDSFFNTDSSNYTYLSEYTLSKKHCLEWLKSASLEDNCKLVNMKVFHMYGEGDNKNKFIPSIIDKIQSNIESLDMTTGNQTRDFIYVEDVIEAFRVVLSSYERLTSFEEYQVGTGNSYSIREAVEMIKEITNSSTNLVFGALPYRTGEIMKSKADISKLINLGWNPTYTLKKGLKNCI